MMLEMMLERSLRKKHRMRGMLGIIGGQAVCMSPDAVTDSVVETKFFLNAAL